MPQRAALVDHAPQSPDVALVVVRLRHLQMEMWQLSSDSHCKYEICAYLVTTQLGAEIVGRAYHSRSLVEGAIRIDRVVMHVRKRAETIDFVSSSRATPRSPILTRVPAPDGSLMEEAFQASTAYRGKGKYWQSLYPFIAK